MTIGTGIALAAMWGAIGCIGVFGGLAGAIAAFSLGVFAAIVTEEAL